MVLDTKRDRVEFIILPVARAMSRFHPNTISWASFVLAWVAGALIFFSPQGGTTTEIIVMLVLASLAVLASGFLDAIDGKVARLTGRASRRGDLLDHILDRYSDVVMIGAVAVSAWCNPYIGMLAIIGVLLTSYMGTQSQAVGAGRLYAGLLGRADRVVLLTIAPLLQALFVFLLVGDVGFGSSMSLYQLSYLEITDTVRLSAFEIVMLWFAVVGNITAVQRAVEIWRKVTD
ncbi:MAG: CDP-alcohol phosphatidyltransferase family protein [Methanomassiliicoccus sp.]|nr:CDP-alcohol phosphatidyltransferase family protein [Methanomassiliicoccus sp.]